MKFKDKHYPVEGFRQNGKKFDEYSRIRNKLRYHKHIPDRKTWLCSIGIHYYTSTGHEGTVSEYRCWFCGKYKMVYDYPKRCECCGRYL